MSATSMDTSQEERRQENFPVDSFRYLEAKLQRVRKLVMDLAAEIAESKDSSPEVYRVGREHIDEALVEFLSDPASAESQLGITIHSKERGADT